MLIWLLDLICHFFHLFQFFLSSWAAELLGSLKIEFSFDDFFSFFRIVVLFCLNSFPLLAKFNFKINFIFYSVRLLIAAYACVYIHIHISNRHKLPLPLYFIIVYCARLIWFENFNFMLRTFAPFLFEDIFCH